MFDQVCTGSIVMAFVVSAAVAGETNHITNGDAEIGTLKGWTLDDGGVPNGTDIFAAAMESVSGDLPFEGDYFFMFDAVGTGDEANSGVVVAMEQTGVIPAGSSAISFSGWNSSTASPSCDPGRFLVRFRDSDGNLLAGGLDSGWIFNPNGQIYSDGAPVPDDAATWEVRLEGRLDCGVFIDTFFDALELNICVCHADLDANCAVDVDDLLVLLSAWGTPNGDVTNDGTTNVDDLLELLGSWGPCQSCSVTLHRMTVEQFLLAALILACGSLVQTVAGFGYGMFAIPLLMMLVGFESYEAISLVAVCVGAQTITGIWKLRHELDKRTAVITILIAGAVLPLGVWAQDIVNEQFGRTVVRQFFGVMILLALVVQWAARIQPREKLHPAWCGLSMSVAGCMGGLAGMGGPAAVMWVMAHNWTPHRSRVTLWALFMGLMPLQFVFLTLQFGESVVTATVTGAFLAPATLLGLFPGLWIGKHMKKSTLRRLGMGILLAVSVWAIVQPWVLTGEDAPDSVVEGTDAGEQAAHITVIDVIA